MATGIEVWPSLAEFYIYDETIYRLLAGDARRNAAYRNAFKKVLNGKTVVEIGPGSELVLSRLCLEAGAKKVYAIELLEETYLQARRQIASLGLEDRIALIHGDARRVELPEKVDYCVSEIVGPIGGSEGSARIIEDCRRFLHDPANMLPARTLTRIAAIDLPEAVVSHGFSEIGMHYAKKTFEKLGYPFDIRVCLRHVSRENLLTPSAVFEDLDYRASSDLEARHEIQLEFQRNGSFTGFMVWLELFVDREETLDTLEHQASWLPVYFPISLRGVAVEAGDRFLGTVTRTLSANGLNPDYAVEGILERRGSKPLKIAYSAPHFEKRYRGNEFYRKLFSSDEKPLLPAGPPRLDDDAARPLGNLSIPLLFAQRMEEAPDRVALVHGCLPGPRSQWTYRAIDEKSNRLAHLLIERGVGPEVAVAVFLNRSPESVIALLAIFKAGGVYVPLDASYPPEHIRFIVEESGARVVLTEVRLAAGIPQCGAALLCVDGEPVRRAQATDSLLANPAGLPASLDHLAMILYTSGSTGRPKGVASPWRQLINRFEWLWKNYPFQEGERVGQRTSVSFIPSVWGMLGALLKGTPTVILPNEVVRDPARLVQVLAEERITRIDLTPSIMKAVLDEAPDLPARLPHLKLWFTAGEALPVDLYERFRKAYPDAAISNDYGSTEVSGVLAFDSRMTDKAAERVPAGRPIANCSAYILDDRLKPVEAGERGELYIGGMPVSRGYVNHPDWTAEKFIPDPFSGLPGARLYSMGDLASLRPDGLIELHGRRDHQIKIRGMRVELGGVEAALGAHPAVRECAAGVHAKASGEQEVVAVAALRTNSSCSPEALLDFLRARLPEAMLPARMILVEALPRTASGKVDRTKLAPSFEPAPAREVRATQEADGMRRRIRELVAEVLDRPQLVEDEDETSFPRLGVTSVTIVDLARKIGAWLGREVSVTELFDHFSVRKLAEHLAQKHGAPLAEAAASSSSNDVDEEHAIAIVGYSGRFPGAHDCDEFWSNLEHGFDAIREIPSDRWDAKRFYDPNPEAGGCTVGKWGGFLDDADQFDPLFFSCSPREARWMDPQQRLFLEECWKALEAAGYPDRELSGRPVGVFAGVRPSDYLSERHGLKAPLDALTLLGNDSAILASRISHFFNLKGPSLSIDTSCSSSLTAVHLACRSLRDGECEMAIAGGACVITAPDFFVQATKAGMLSKTGRCRTFDRDADGFAPGEGAGVVILKTLARARRDGDTIHGVIRAIGINQDGNTGGLTVPNTLAQCELEKAVYREAGINPETIGYVEAHGTGTRLGDPIEVEALTKAFGEFTHRKRFCRIGSVKENIGHLAAASGVAGLIKVLLALRHKRIPPNVHAKNPNPAIDFENSPFLLDDRAQDWEVHDGVPRRAAVSSFGFSGTNAHMVVEEWREAAKTPPAAKAAYLFTLSAKSERALERGRRDLAAWLAGAGRNARPEDVSYTLNAGRSHFPHRLWWVAGSIDELARQIASSGAVSGPLAETGARYAAGAEVDWKLLHEGESRRIVALPTYPFERKRYWHKERPASETLSMYRPRWVPAARSHAEAGASGGPVVAIRGAETGEIEAAVAAAHPGARIVGDEDSAPLTGDGPVYFLDDSAAGLSRLFRLVWKLDAARPVDLTVATRGIFEDANPNAEALFGFCRSLAKERPAWTIRGIDIAEPGDFVMAPAGFGAVRDGVYYRRILEPVSLPPANASAFREGGTYLIAGGAGGIGLSLARYLAEKYQAHSILIGRSELSPERRREITALGADYFQADIADLGEIEGAVRKALTRTGVLHGVFHSALELNDAPISGMDDRTFAAGLRAKIDGTIALHRAVAGIPLDFFVCFSSVQSFLGNEGQANYAAACAFQDAWARAANRTSDYPVQTINWGFWGEVGAVATEGFRRLWASRGVDSIGVEEGMEAVERILACRYDQVVVPKANAGFLAGIGALGEGISSENGIDMWAANRLHRAFAGMGALAAAGERHVTAGLKQQLGVARRHERLFDAMIAILTGAGIVAEDAGEIVVLHDVPRADAPGENARGRLVEACMDRFPELLRGEIAATEVLFPNSSLDLVENLYRSLPDADSIMSEVARIASSAGSAAQPLRILEIGAGTGATSAVVLKALDASPLHARYVYTDVSSAFLTHGKRRFAAAYPFLEFSLLDIEEDAVGQRFSPESFDLVIAANVLHATRDIRRTLGQVRGLLRPSGRLILHEQTRLEPFLTLTFGWLEGWWRFEDTRQPHGPLLSVDDWKRALGEAGFDAVSATGGEEANQHVLIAQNQGAVRQNAARHISQDSSGKNMALGRASERITAAMRSVLEIDTADLDPEKPFVDYGVDSILALALVNTINRDLNCGLKASDLYSCPSIHALARRIETREKERGEERIASMTAKPAIPAKLAIFAKPAIAPVESDGRIAIVGMSGRFPGAENVVALWEMLAAGKSAIREVPRERWNAAAYYDADYRTPGKTNSRWGGFLSEIDRFDAAFFNILPVEAEWMDPQQRLFLEEAWRALEDAGYPDRALNGKKVGVFVGCKEGDYSRLFPEEQKNPYYSVGSNSSILAARISYALNLKGPSLAVDTACSSSLVAIQLACERLRRHPEEIALAGGVAVMCTPHTHLLLGKSGMLSPDGRCKTFSQDADGFVPGEAIGVVVLKPLAAALRDGDPIRGVILGIEANQDGRTNGITAPNAESQAELEKEVYAAADIGLETIGYVETHGTGTKLGDAIEIEALSAVFGGDGAPALGSVKTNIGHTLAAAGIASLIKVLTCMEHGKLVPTLNLARVSDALHLDGSRLTFNTELRDWLERSGNPRRAAVSSFGFSGTNVHMVVEEAPLREAARRSQPAWLIPLSAKTPAALERRIDDLLRWAKSASFELSDIAYTLLRGRSHFAIRAAMVARDKAEFLAQLESIRNKPVPDSVFYRCEPAAEQPALKQWGASALEEIRDGSLDAEVYRERLLAMADLFAKGYGLDWDRLLPDGGRRISLPTYPFDGERYWVSGAPTAKADRRVLQVLAQNWRTCPAMPQEAADRGTVVVLAAAGNRAFAAGLFKHRNVVVATTPAELRSAAPRGAIAGCVDLTALETDADWHEAIWSFLQQCVEESRGNSLKLLKVCRGLAAHRSDEAGNEAELEGIRLAGLYRMLGAEYRHVDSRVLDTDAALDEQLKTQILAEWSSAAPSLGWCCYRDGERLEPEFVPAAANPAQQPYSQDDVVVITGGTRGVGATMAEHMAAKGVRKLAIMGREPLPDRACWDELAPETDAERKIARLRALEAQGVQVEIYTGPLNDRLALEAFHQRIRRELGPITGLLHCAGLARTDHPAFIRKTLDDLRAVCEPKIDGLLCLDEVFGDEPLRFFVLFSSVAAALPSLGAGQSDYAMANAWMDDFARHRFQQGKRHYRSMQWPNWEALGMGDTTSAAYDATGLLSHTPEEGLRLFEQALAVDCAVTLPCVSTGELRFEVSPAAAPARRVPQAHDTRQPRQQAANSTMDWLSELFARELKLGSSRLDPRAGFADQGIDSILMAELVRSIERALGVSLPPSLLFEHTTVAALHDYLARDFPEAIKARGGADEAVAATVVQPEHPRPYSSRPDSLSADIAVIGLSCRFPGAPDATAFWNLLRRGESAIGRTPEERWAEVGREWFGGFVEGIDEFDPEFFRLSEEDAAIMDPQARLILEESARTLYDAGYGEHGLDGRRVGVYIGARASAARDENILRAANPILGLGQNYIAANISRCFNFAGPSLVVDTACSSALVGMHLAVRALQNGEIDYALVGGVSLLLDDTAHRLFASRRLLRPDGVFHLFDRRADGVVLGEGAGAVLLKPLDAALRDGDCIEGVIKGIAVNNNGRTAGPNAPSFQAQKDVIAAALRESGKRADEIAEIEASGSGSMVNDLLELKSLAAVLGGKRATCYLGSVKTNVGHLLSAAGAASFLKAVLSVRHGEHTPHLSAEQLPLYFDFKQAGFEIGRKLRPWAGPGSRTACVTSFPDGGTNCCVVIEYPEAIPAARREAIPGPFFRKRKLIERRIGEALEAEAAIRPVRAAVPEPVFAVANGKGEDFWGLTE